MPLAWRRNKGQVPMWYPALVALGLAPADADASPFILAVTVR